MRLCRSSFSVKTPFVYDQAVAPLFTGDSVITVADPFSTCGLSPMLLLPQSFGNIYLGETFRTIRVLNTSPQTIYGVVVKVSFLSQPPTSCDNLMHRRSCSNSQRVLLLDTVSAPMVAPTKDGVDQLAHELRSRTFTCTCSLRCCLCCRSVSLRGCVVFVHHPFVGSVAGAVFVLLLCLADGYGCWLTICCALICGELPRAVNACGSEKFPIRILNPLLITTN